MGEKSCKLMYRLALTEHQRNLLDYSIGCAIGDHSLKLVYCDKRDKTYIRDCQEQIDALNEIKETLSKCETYYEEV